MTATRHDIHRTAAQPSIDDLMVAHTEQAADAAISRRMDDIADAVVQRLSTDPYGIYRNRESLYTVADIAEIMHVNPETVREWTRLDTNHPRHLPRVTDHPITILPAAFANWLEQQHKQAGSR